MRLWVARYCSDPTRSCLMCLGTAPAHAWSIPGDCLELQNIFYLPKLCTWVYPAWSFLHLQEVSSDYRQVAGHWLPAVYAELGWFCSFGVSGYSPPWMLISTLEHKETCLGTVGPAWRNAQNHPNSAWRVPISQMLKWERGVGVEVISLSPAGSLFQVNLT